MNRNLWLLAVLQGLFLTNNVTFIAINGLVGLSLAPSGWMATLLSWRPLRYLGKISYGVYVYHFFLRTALPAVGSALGVAGPEPGWGYFVIYSAAAVAVASVSWYFIEKPAIGLKDRLVLQPAPSA